MKRGFLYSLGLSRKTFSNGFTPILLISLLSVITVTPKFFNEIYMAVLWIIFYLVEFNQISRSRGKLGKLLFLGIMYISICALYALMGISSASVAYCVHNPALFFAVVLALIIIDKCGNEQQIRFLFHFLAIAIAINIADNIRLTYQIGLKGIVYQRLSGMIADEGLTGLNLGGAGFVNMAVFYACTMFMAYLASNERKEKMLFLIYTGISAYFITFCSLKASAFLFAMMSMALMYVSVKNKKRVDVMLTVLGIFGLLVFLLRDFIINFLIDIIDSDRITSRLIVFTSEADLEDNSSLMSREQLWFISIKSWLNNGISFFLGIGDHRWSDFTTTAHSGIGNHSDLFDVFGRYGVIGALILYTAIKTYYDYLRERFGKFFKYEVISFMVLLFAMGFTKRFITAQQAIVIFILFPLALRYLSIQGKIKNR